MSKLTGHSNAAWEALNRHVHSIPDLLRPWLTVLLPVQPCLCDCWHDNLLFEWFQFVLHNL